MKFDNVIFVKHGNKYNAEHVNRLADQLFKYYPTANFYCYTENSTGVEITTIPVFKKPTLRFWWNKLPMFSEEFPVQGKCLYFDLDMDIKEDFSSFAKCDGLTVLNAYWKKDFYMDRHSYDVSINSSIITWVAGEQSHIWKHFLSNKDYFTRKYSGIDRFLIHEGFELNRFEDGIVNSIANPLNRSTPIDMYNGLNYELQRECL